MKKKWIIVICFLLVGIYFGYKGFCLYYYNINNTIKETINNLKITDTIIIKNEKLEEAEYLVFNDINIINDFTDFKKIEDQSSNEFVKYALYNEDNELKASFWMGRTSTYLELLKSDKTTFGTEDKRITNNNLTNILEKNNIKNDIDLFKYLEKQKDEKNNIFTSVKRMKEKFTLNYIISIIFPLIDDISLIEGDYEGYVFNLKNNIKEVSILKNNRRYVFTFFKTDYFTDDYIKEILNTIIIGDENKTNEQIMMVNDTLYYNTNKESTIDSRCGNMDGYINSSVSSETIPTINNQSNFGSGYGYQYINDWIEVAIDGKFMIFESKEK